MTARKHNTVFLANILIKLKAFSENPSGNKELKFKPVEGKIMT
jgi:hypothetical protein